MLDSRELLDIDYGNEFNLNGEIRNHLFEVAKWAQFLSIVGFIFTGLLFLGALSIRSLDASVNSIFPYASLLLMLVYLVLASIYFFPVVYLYRFSLKMKSALSQNDEAGITEAFRSLKAHYRFLGILTVLILAFYTFGILFGFSGIPLG